MRDTRESYTVQVSPVTIEAYYYITRPDGNLVNTATFETEEEAMIALAAMLSGQGYGSDLSFGVGKAYFRSFKNHALQLNPSSDDTPTSKSGSVIDVDDDDTDNLH